MYRLLLGLRASDRAVSPRNRSQLITVRSNLLAQSVAFALNLLKGPHSFGANVLTRHACTSAFRTVAAQVWASARRSCCESHVLDPGLAQIGSS
jgi:hypothetical protein